MNSKKQLSTNFNSNFLSDSMNVSEGKKHFSMQADVSIFKLQKDDEANEGRYTKRIWVWWAHSIPLFLTSP